MPTTPKKLRLTEGEQTRERRAAKTVQRLAGQSISSFADAEPHPTAHRSMIYKYMDGFSTEINKHMWGGNRGREIPKDYKTLRTQVARKKVDGLKLKRQLDRHSPEMEQDTHVYHGWKPNEAPKSGAVVPVRGFLSTSVHPTTASTFATDKKHYEGGKLIQTRHILRIKVPAGTKHGAYVSHFSKDYQDEREFLVRPGRKLHIKGKPKVVVKKYPNKPWEDHHDETHFHVWHAELKEGVDPKIKAKHQDDMSKILANLKHSLRSIMKDDGAPKKPKHLTVTTDNAPSPPKHLTVTTDRAPSMKIHVNADHAAAAHASLQAHISAAAAMSSVPKSKKPNFSKNFYKATQRRNNLADKKHGELIPDARIGWSSPHRHPIKSYTNSSAYFNRVLWGDKPKKDGDRHIQKIERSEYAKELNKGRHLVKALDSIPPKKDIVVYHGWKGDKAPVENSSIKTKGFLSTSIHPDTATSFAKHIGPEKHVLRMKIPADSKHGAYVAGHSDFENEREFILKPKRKLTFNKKMSYKEPNSGGVTTHVWNVDIKEGFLERQDRIEKVHKKLSKDTKSDYKLTDVGSRWTFNKYIHGKSHELNKAMWNKPEKSNRIARHQATKQFQFARQLTKSMNKSKGMRDDTTIYHGWKGPNDLHVGKEIKTKGFTSTSVDIETATRFATQHFPKGSSVFNADNKTINNQNISHVLRIKMPKGSKHGVYVTPFASGKGYSSEKEVLLRPHRKLTITKGPHKHTDEAGNNYHFWHAELKENRNAT